jgi:hypothetical protein
MNAIGLLWLGTDKNMRYQQNMAGRTIAVVVIGLQPWPALEPHVALVVAAVNAATPGSFTFETPSALFAIPATSTARGTMQHIRTT